MDRKIKAALGGRTGETEAKMNNECEYKTARKSVRIWPIKGNNEEEITKATREFIEKALLVRNYEGEVGEIRVKRIRERAERDTTVYGEVLVTFQDDRTRDFVASRGAKLAGFVDERRKPTCGIRMEIPEFLNHLFKIMKRYTYLLKKENPSVKSYIKFDDYKQSLYVQVKIREGMEWVNIYPEEVHEYIRKHENLRTQNTRQLLSPAKRAAQYSPGIESINRMEVVPEEIQESSQWVPPKRPRREMNEHEEI